MHAPRRGRRWPWPQRDVSDIHDEAAPIGFTCGSMKASKLDGVYRELWASGAPKREQGYVDGEATRQITDHDPSGAKTEESFDDGSLVG